MAQFGVIVEIIGTFGIALILARHFHHGLDFLFSSEAAENASTNALGSTSTVPGSPGRR